MSSCETSCSVRFSTHAAQQASVSAVWWGRPSLYFYCDFFHHRYLKRQLVRSFVSELLSQVSGRSAVLLWSRRQQNSVLLPVRRTSSIFQTGRRPRSGAGTPGAPRPVVPAVLSAWAQRRHLEPPAAPVHWVRGLDQQRETRERAVRGQNVITQWLHSGMLTYGKVLHGPIHARLLLRFFSCAEGGFISRTAAYKLPAASFWNNF